MALIPFTKQSRWYRKESCDNNAFVLAYIASVVISAACVPSFQVATNVNQFSGIGERFTAACSSPISPSGGQYWTPMRGM